MNYKNTGILTSALLKELNRYPSEERIKKGPCAVCECVDEIPCNPCESACPFKAIYIGENISHVPKVNYDKCTGCGSCVPACSGLATFVVDKSYSDTVGSVAFPYEYIHSYQAGDVVKAADRSGKNVCDGTIKKIALTKRADMTTVITLEVPIDYVDEVRSIYREHGRGGDSRDE